MTHYKIGYYKPTFEFTRISEFMAILDESGNPVGLTGPATSRQAALNARLFAASPDLLFSLKALCILLEQLQADSGNLSPALLSELKVGGALERAHSIIYHVENGSR